MDRLRDVVLDSLGTPRKSTTLIAGLPLLFWSVPFAVTVVLFGPLGVLFPPVLMAIVVHGLWVLAQVYGAYRLRSKPLESERYPRLLAWFLGIGTAFFLVNVAGTLTSPPIAPIEVIGWLAFSWNMGSGVGLLVGFIEARAIDRAVTAERAATESELLEEQRDRFAYMNAILRHEVLNNVQVIRGQAEYLLAEDPDEETAGHLEIIERQSQDMVDVVQDIRTVGKGLEDAALHPVDLRSILRAELIDLADTYDDVETELTCPNDVNVVADDLLDRVFSNLLANAVEHNEGTANVTVDVDIVSEADLGPTAGSVVDDGAADAEAVVITVADDGTGVPEPVQRSMFDHDRGPHGVGLYLVDTLVSHYGGDVELTETGPDGATFSLILQRAPAPGLVGGTATATADDETTVDGNPTVADEPATGERDAVVDHPSEDHPSVSRPTFDWTPVGDGED